MQEELIAELESKFPLETLLLYEQNSFWDV